MVEVKAAPKSKKATEKPKATERTSNRLAVADLNESMRHPQQSRPAEIEAKDSTILSLNDDCLLEIFSYVGVTDLVYNIGPSCRRLRTLADDAVREKCRKECFYYFVQDRKDAAIVKRFGDCMREIYVNGSNCRSDLHSLAWLSVCSSLKSLKFSNMDLKYEWSWECLKTLNGLEHLDLERCNSHSSTLSMESIILSCKKLKSISIMCQPENMPYKLLDLISRIESIERITIKTWGSPINGISIYVREYATKFARLTKLKYLHIDCMHFDCEHFIRALSGSQSLEELSLYTNYLNNGLMAALDTFESLKSCRIHYSFCSDTHSRPQLRYDTPKIKAAIKQFDVVEKSYHKCDPYHVYNVLLTRKN